jgi:general secretion pathway protein A
MRAKRVRRHTLRDGDVVQLGQHELLYIDDHAASHLVNTHDDLKPVGNAANEDNEDNEDEENATRGDAAGAH